MKLSQITKNGKPTWRLAYSEDGPVGRIEKRRFFGTEAEGQKIMSELLVKPEDTDGEWKRLSALTKRDVLQALDIAKIEGERLTVLLHRWRGLALKAGEMVPPKEGSTSVPLPTALTAMMVEKRDQGLSDRYRAQLEWTVQSYVTNREHVLCDAVTTREIANWLTSKGWSLQTRKTIRTDMRTFFSFAIAQGWAARNPVDAIPVPKPKKEAVRIFTVDQVSHLMHTCQEHDPEFTTYLALGFFLGIRPEREIPGLEASAVLWEQKIIKVPANLAKDGNARQVKIPDNAMVWLKRWHEMPIVNVRERLERIRKKAGMWTDWPQDVMRHCFASYHLALHEDVGRTVTQMGHRGSPKVFFDHYCNLVMADQGKAYFSILPQ